ncbi:hypothetical protein JDN40_11760 [Rhodomicrobium vannielii ATCC 17100]|uniref:hypothetical protein n=1 Tax=Rhodomicrobium vannielii TaxID=1069 RepID=UPI001919E987|nr:hypothetical protein [Rhodomicrobium vannielii]MBJ7534782.1 hypothetical protein [Rhodomicrobium vannielii ATCC 17100]
MQLRQKQEIILSQDDETVNFECQMETKVMLILALWLLVGLITTLGGVAILLRLVHLAPHYPLGVGFIPISFGCCVFGASWLLARLASTVSFDLKQELITITPKWRFGRRQTLHFDEVQCLYGAKRLVGVLPLIIQWRFFFMLKTGKRISFGETYNAARRDIFIRGCTDKISSVTGIASKLDYSLKHVLFI